jgi:hypothetical protein
VRLLDRLIPAFIPLEDGEVEEVMPVPGIEVADGREHGFHVLDVIFLNCANASGSASMIFSCLRNPRRGHSAMLNS